MRGTVHSINYLNYDLVTGKVWLSREKPGRGIPGAVYSGRVARWRVKGDIDTSIIMEVVKRAKGHYKVIGDRVVLTDTGVLIMWEISLIVENA